MKFIYFNDNISIIKMSQMYKKKAQEDPDKYGKNGGQPWSEKEHELLLKEVNKKNLQEISISHERTENAICARLKYLARNMINEGKTIEEAQKIVKLVSIEEIKKFINSENKKKEVKEHNKEILKEVKNKDDKEENKVIELEKRINSIEDKLNTIIEQLKEIQNKDSKKVKIKK